MISLGGFSSLISLTQSLEFQQSLGLCKCYRQICQSTNVLLLWPIPADDQLVTLWWPWGYSK